MITSNDDPKGIKVYFSPQVKNKSKKTIENTLKDALQRTKKNQEFFYSLFIKAYGLWSEREKLEDIAYDICGFTYPSLANDYTITIRTNRDLKKERGFNLSDTRKNSEIKSTLLHEIGHIFNFYFASPNQELKNELSNRIEQNPETFGTQEFYELYELYELQDDLSDSEEFKNAWRKDVETAFKGKSKSKNERKCKRLGYYSPLYKYEESNPYKTVNIKLEDGIDDIELNSANRARGEIFAQLFSYSMGGNKYKLQKRIVTHTYKNSYEVVKKYVDEYLGINTKSSHVSRTQNKLDCSR